MAKAFSASPPERYLSPYFFASLFAIVLFPHPVMPATHITIFCFRLFEAMLDAPCRVLKQVSEAVVAKLAAVHALQPPLACRKLVELGHGQAWNP